MIPARLGQTPRTDGGPRRGVAGGGRGRADRRALPRPHACRAGRHGRRVAGRGRAPAAGGGPQTGVAARGCRRRGPRPGPSPGVPRGADDRPAAPPSRDRGLRRHRARRAAVAGHGVPALAQPRRGPRRRRPAGPRARRAHRAPGGRRAGRRPRGRDGAPRHQARQRPARRRRTGQGHRLRHRPRRRRRHHHLDRHDGGHPGLPGARGGAGRDGRLPLGRLLAGVDALHGDRGRAALRHGRQPPRRPAPRRLRRVRPAVPAGPDHPADRAPAAARPREPPGHAAGARRPRPARRHRGRHRGGAGHAVLRPS